MKTGDKSIGKEILREITLEDLQIEAQWYLGRELHETELNKAKKLLQISFEEAHDMIFSFVFNNLSEE